MCSLAKLQQSGLGVGRCGRGLGVPVRSVIAPGEGGYRRSNRVSPKRVGSKSKEQQLRVTAKDKWQTKDTKVVWAVQAGGQHEAWLMQHFLQWMPPTPVQPLLCSKLLTP